MRQVYPAQERRTARAIQRLGLIHPGSFLYHSTTNSLTAFLHAVGYATNRGTFHSHATDSYRRECAMAQAMSTEVVTDMSTWMATVDRP